MIYSQKIQNRQLEKSYLKSRIFSFLFSFFAFPYNSPQYIQIRTMPFINPYIEKVQNNRHIILEEKEAIKQKWAWKSYFENNNPIHLEIGTGLGNFFGYQTGNHPEINFIGMEIKFKRVFKTYEKAIQNGGQNFVVLKLYAEKIADIFWEEEIDTTYIFFPDPWDKKEHQKKNRLIKEDFLSLLYQKTKLWGKLIFKTDHSEYFDEVLWIIEAWDQWKKEKISYDYEQDKEIFDIKKITSFEAMYRGDKKQICYAEFERI